MTSLDPVVWAAVVAFLPCGAATIEAARLSRDTRAACLAHVARIARRAATAIASPQPACLDRSQGPSLDPLNLRQNPNLLLIPAPPSSPNTQPTLLDVRAVATLHAVLNAVPTALLDTSSNLYALCVGAVLRHLVALIQTECGGIDDSVFGGGDLPRVLCEALRLLRRLLSLYLLDFDRPLPDVTGLADDVLDTVIYLTESLVHWENLGESLLLLAIQIGRKLDAVGPKSNNWSLAGFRAVRIWLTLHRSFQISQTRSQLLNQIAESLCACAAPESPDLDLLTFALARSSREYFLSPVLAACLRSAWSMGGPFRDSAEESLLELAEGVFGEAATDDNAVKGVLQFCMLAVNVMAEDGRTSDTSRLPGLVELPLGLEPMLMSLLMPLMASAEDRVVTAASRRITRALVQHWNTNERVEGKSDRSTEDSFLEFWGRCLEVKEFNFRSKFDIIGLFEILLNYVCTETDRLIAWKLSAHRICQGFTSDQMEAVDVGCYAAATLLEKVLRNDSDAASFSKAVRDNPNCRVQDIVHGINQWCVKCTTKRSDIGASINHFIAAALRFSSPSLLPPVSLDPLMNWIAEKADKTWAEIYARLCLVRPQDHVVVNVTQLLDLIRESQSKIHVNFAAKSLAWIFMNSDWSTTTAVWNRFFLEAWEAMLQAAPVCGLEIVNPITTLARSLRTLNDAEAVFSLTSSFRCGHPHFFPK
ncbi:hypothetical protein DFJ73DRAFT_309881 [Zopfochytrium polystomum]|nr:hypothetical protein DFJ73DRAFT_309881 [Zopfochytrium polystomum]